jgi:hypothetical protein
MTQSVSIASLVLIAGLPWSSNQTMGIVVDFLKSTIGGAKH